MNSVEFSKYNGLGNDFILIDALNDDIYEKLINKKENIVSTMCNRNFGIGADGLILALPSTNHADVRMRILNSDSTEPEMCGNGIRCLVQFLIDKKLLKDNINSDFKIQTLAGVLTAKRYEDNLISVNMGNPIIEPKDIPTDLSIGSYSIPQGLVSIDDHTLEIFSVGMGNPHLVTFTNDLDKIPFKKWGNFLENHFLFPQKTNVHFVQLINRNSIRIVVWERGCGLTLACGTGACASVVASSILGLTEREVKVSLPGGDLIINWPDNDSPVYMKGPAKLNFTGNFKMDDIL